VFCGPFLNTIIDMAQVWVVLGVFLTAILLHYLVLQKEGFYVTPRVMSSVRTPTGGTSSGSTSTTTTTTTTAPAPARALTTTPPASSRGSTIDQLNKYKNYVEKYYVPTLKQLVPYLTGIAKNDLTKLITGLEGALRINAYTSDEAKLVPFQLFVDDINISIPILNKILSSLKLPLAVVFSPSSATPPEVPAILVSFKCKGIDKKTFRYDNGTKRNYATMAIADSWDKNWRSAPEVDCSTLPDGPPMAMLTSFRCKGIANKAFRYDAGKRREYASTAIADSWDKDWRKGPTIDCTNYPQGKPMAMKPAGVAGAAGAAGTAGTAGAGASTTSGTTSTGLSALIGDLITTTESQNQYEDQLRTVVRDEIEDALGEIQMGPRDTTNVFILDRNTPLTGANLTGVNSDSLQQGTEYRTYSTPYTQGQIPSYVTYPKPGEENKPIDMNDYVRKDSIPCWGCSLK
jgi:hypothetical protein